jgi:hypothetical protein
MMIRPAFRLPMRRSQPQPRLHGGDYGEAAISKVIACIASHRSARCTGRFLMLLAADDILFDELPWYPENTTRESFRASMWLVE